MNTKTPFIILSASLSGENNVYRTILLKDMLIQLDIKFHEAKGMYKGIPENSFFVIPKNSDEMELVTGLAFNNFGQESVLTQDSAGVCYLEYNDRSVERIGTMKEIDSVEGLDAYTQIYDKYYIVA